MWVGGFDDLAQMSAIENPPTHKGSGYRVRRFTNWHAVATGASDVTLADKPGFFGHDFVEVLLVGYDMTCSVSDE